MARADFPEMTAEQRSWVSGSQNVADSEAARRVAYGRCFGLDFDDLRSAANWGLIRASYAFEPGRGLKFATLGATYARQEIHDTIRRTARRRRPGGRSRPETASLEAIREEMGSHVDLCVDHLVGPACDPEELDALRGALGDIPEAEAQVIKMRAEGVDLAEIGRRLGMTKGKARYLSNLAIDHLCDRMGTPRSSARRQCLWNRSGVEAGGTWTPSPR